MGKKAMVEQKGTVFWITGLSGAGKTTVGGLLYRRLREQNSPVVYLDGDILRKVSGDDLGYSREDRLYNAMRIASLCHLLTSQGIDVVCATISMFRECWRWNRENIENYVEIYLRVPVRELVQRDPKGLYADAQKGTVQHIVGFNMEFQEPEYPDLIIDNYGDLTPAAAMGLIWETFVIAGSALRHDRMTR
jgi:adenylylsulfate kinase